MKTLLISVVGSLLGLLLGLLAYDHFIAQPREARLLASMHAMFEDAAKAWPDVNAQREEAVRIAAELDASVGRSLDGARQVLDNEAAAVEQRAALANGLMRASLPKVMLAEHYMSMGTWPTTASELGLSEAHTRAAGAVRSIALGTEGTLEIVYGSPLPDGTTLRLQPVVDEVGGFEWRCEASGLDDRSLLPLQCR